MAGASSCIDITPTVSERIGVFPGDVAFQRDISLDFAKGQNLLLSSIRTSLHLGAHADGPNHYNQDGLGIGARDLGYYMGPCLVLEAKLARGTRVTRRHLSEKWQTVKSWPAARVLIRTGSFPDPDRWNSDFCSLDPGLIDEFARGGVRLIGIDTPSIDPEDSKSLEAHAMVARHDLAILEGLDLSQAPEGAYTLIALPLKLESADASPVRAVLLKDLSPLKA